MSLRLEMLQVARLAPKLLGESACLVQQFLRSQQNSDGGFKDRAGRSDLYYTAIGLDALIALQAALPKETVTSYLLSFGDGAGLDFVHLCCLARAWAALQLDQRPDPWPHRTQLLRRVAAFRSQDGGFNPKPRHPHGTAYAAFLAVGAHEDLSAEVPSPSHLIESLLELKTADQAWANERGVALAATNATAAAVNVLRRFGHPIARETTTWLLAQAHPLGGFRATPTAPIPDLLSTATALHTLAGLQVPLETIRESCLDFVDSLWTNAGSFHGHWAEDILDCEYTFYGLLTLGHLSV